MPSDYTISTDALYPRDEEHRYRIYARRGRNELEILAATGSAGGIGVALVQLDEDEREQGRRLMDRGAIGVLDVVESRWLVMPWHRREAEGAGSAVLGLASPRSAPAPSTDEWVGATVRPKARGAPGRLWRVEGRGPLGYRIVPLDAQGDPEVASPTNAIRPITRSRELLERRWKIVNRRGGD